MVAPFAEPRMPENRLPEDLTVEDAITRWRESRNASLTPPFPEALLAPGELHGLMGPVSRRRQARRPVTPRSR